MSIVTEDGTGLATAESLISVSDCDTHHAARGNSTWATITTAQKEQALRRATEYMIQVYTTRWQGVRTYPETQALDWPRTGVSVDGSSIDYNIVPQTVERACAELALRAAAGPLLGDLKQAKIAVTVGPIKTEFDRNSPQWKRYKSIDAMLVPYLKSGSSISMGLVRT